MNTNEVVTPHPTHPNPIPQLPLPTHTHSPHLPTPSRMCGAANSPYPALEQSTRRGSCDLPALSCSKSAGTRTLETRSFTPIAVVIDRTRLQVRAGSRDLIASSNERQETAETRAVGVVATSQPDTLGALRLVGAFFEVTDGAHVTILQVPLIESHR